MKRALLTGIAGQTDSYLAELLLENGCEVFGLVRRSSSLNTARIDHLYRDPHDRDSRFHLLFGDLSDASSLNAIIREVQPEYVFNLGAQSHVRVSFDIPEYTADITGVGPLRLLEAIRAAGLPSRFVQASSSEMFGSSPPPQNEETLFHPRSPYACAKIFGFHSTVNYRESYGLFAANAILFNTESERRGETFVTKKITRAAGRIKIGLQDKLYLGNLDACRDWGHARDYAEALWRIAQQEQASDYVIATGETHSVREFLDEAFGYLDLDWHKYVEIDPRYFRPAEVDVLLGDASKARRELGWEPKTTFKELVRLMVDHDLKLAEGEKVLRKI